MNNQDPKFSEDLISSENNTEKKPTYQKTPEIGDEVEIKAKPIFILFPSAKNNAHITIEKPWGCVKFIIKEVLEGTVTTQEKMNGIIVTGDYGFDLMDKEHENDTYKLRFKRDFNRKRNASENKLFSITTFYDFKNTIEQKNFLKHIITENQIQGLYSDLKEPFKAIQNGDIKTLCGVKGIGEVVAQRIIDKYNDNIIFSDIFVALPNLDLTPIQLKSLVDHFGTSTAMIAAIKDNPYRLIEASGFSFRKCDTVALQMGVPPKSVKRIKPFILHYLEEQADNGFNWATDSELNTAIGQLIEGVADSSSKRTDKITKNYLNQDYVNEAIAQLEEEEVLIVDEVETSGRQTQRSYFLNKIFDIEDEVAERLATIIQTPPRAIEEGWEERVKAIEERNGWQFNAEQLKGIKKGCESNILVISGGAGCVDCETEYMSETGWKRIDQFNYKDKVLQYKSNGHVELIKPASYIKQPCEMFIEFKSINSDGIDMCLSNDHNILYTDTKGIKRKDTVQEVLAQHRARGGFTGTIPSTFKSEINSIDLQPKDIHLLASMSMAEEFWYNKATETCFLAITKESPAEEEFLLSGYKPIQITTTEECYSNEEIIKEKTTCNIIFGLNTSVADIFSNWLCLDGDSVIYLHDVLEKIRRENIIVKTRSNAIANFVQGIYTLSGETTGVETKDLYFYVVDYNRENYTLTNNTARRKILLPTTIPSADGYKYCFSVPSGNLVFRRHGRIFISGNCGKTSSLQGLLGALNLPDEEIAMCAFTGKAAAKMASATGKTATTIHRLLQFQGFEPLFNEDNKLPYKMIIMDEFSMTPIILLRALLRAMTDDCRLIFLGDMGQLQSIGMGNLATDLIEAVTVPSVNLVEPMRQAKESGIICLAMDHIRKGVPLFADNFIGEQMVKEDTYVYSDANSEALYSAILEDFKERWDSGKINSRQDFIFLTPVKYNGPLCMARLNNAIQDIVNPQSKLKEFLKEELVINFGVKKDSIDEGNIRDFTLRVGDSIICTKNNYKAKLEVAEEDPDSENSITTAIFNGWGGELVKLDKVAQIGYFRFFDAEDGMPNVVMSVEEIKECIQLGYAISVHKAQGGEWKEVYVALDNSSYMLLSRELLYTAVTRAQHRLLMYVNPRAMNRAIRTVESKIKRTFLCPLIDGKNENVEDIPF